MKASVSEIAISKQAAPDSADQLVGQFVSRDVNDIHSVLEVTVYDQDKDHAVDFLGKLASPVLQVPTADGPVPGIYDYRRLVAGSQGDSMSSLRSASKIFDSVHQFPIIQSQAAQIHKWWLI